MKKVLKIIGIIILIPVVLIIGLLVLTSFVPAVPKNYTKEVKTGGDIEAKYLAMGEYKVKNTKIKATELTKYYYVYYQLLNSTISFSQPWRSTFFPAVTRRSDTFVFPIYVCKITLGIKTQNVCNF